MGYTTIVSSSTLVDTPNFASSSAIAAPRSLSLIFSLLVIFAGCRKLHQAEEYLDHKLDVAEEQVEQAVQEAISPTVSPEITASSEGITEVLSIEATEV